MIQVGEQVELFGNTKVQQEHDKDFRKFCDKLNIVYTQVRYSFLKDNFGDYWLVQVEYHRAGDLVLYIPPFVRGIVHPVTIKNNSLVEFDDKVEVYGSDKRFCGLEGDFCLGNRFFIYQYITGIIQYNAGKNITIVGPNKPLEGSVRQMFNGVIANKVSFKSFDISKITKLEGVFSDSTINEIDFSGIQFGKPKSLAEFISNCKGIKSLDISSLDLQECTDLQLFCYFSYDLEAIKFPRQELPDSVKMISSFEFCEKLKHVNMQDLTFKGKVKIHRTFADCAVLEELDLRTLTNAGQLGGVVGWCENLKRIILSRDLVIDRDRKRVERMLVDEQHSDQVVIKWV